MLRSETTLAVSSRKPCRKHGLDADVTDNRAAPRCFVSYHGWGISDKPLLVAEALRRVAENIKRNDRTHRWRDKSTQIQSTAAGTEISHHVWHGGFLCPYLRETLELRR